MSSNDEIAHAIAGAGGGALSMIVTYPLVTLSTLAQTAAKKKEEKQKDEQELKATISPTTQAKILNALRNNPSWLATKEIIREKGITGLYAGLESALYGITLTNFIYYYFYEFTANLFLKSKKSHQRGLTTFESIITGAIAGAVTCVGSNPFWVANTRMMTEKKKKGEGKTSSSTFKALLDIIEKDGVGTLFAGVLPALILVINPIIQYTIFEQIKNVIIAKNGPKSFTSKKAFLIGAFGKLIATSLTYPYITLKARMHIKKKATKSEDEKLSMIQQIRKIIREEGLEGLYGGLLVKLVQSISTAAFLFYFKEELLVGSVKLVEILRMINIKKANPALIGRA
ncbi:uncharacterized protein J8A68_001604 [[Candida] subhashii]|uniref:Peroxisomal membrane protein PMP47A n=1 Tax=[Candida] subhashii TaxID=561895 RepID=A0A8J5UQL0_9ASCO|nr:uncharacterized protein J8A68_001604 [[Candida] subhashii]KAG7664846.1 hypothetical protein J8A68_001604 [[Candida] subhashii]